MVKVGDWKEANTALGQLAEWHRELAALTQARDESIQKAREGYTAAAAPISGKIERLEADLRRFALEHQEELPGRSIGLELGRLGLLLVTEIRLRSLKKAIAWLLEARKLQFLRVKHELNKEALRTAPPDILKACGAKAVSRDEFWYEVDDVRHAVAE